jgi:hypothetical protein
MYRTTNFRRRCTVIEDRNLKPGTVLIARYHKKDHRCEVVKGEDGRVAFRVSGKEYGSPSAAGSAVMGGVSCNGWRWWTIEGAETKKPAKSAKSTKKLAKSKAAAKPEGKAKKARTVAGGANGDEPPVEKPVNCGEGGQEFPTSREAGDHMRDEHGSAEAAGVGA